MQKKSIISCSIGNILEWYDFGLFAIYSPLFSRLFLSSIDPNVALIETLSIFAIGFLCRPLGALLFGYLGDKYGRAKTLRLSILMISLPTLLIGFLPTYATLGLSAPILLMLIRIWQGISLGGEYSGNLIYLAESAPPTYRATITSFAGAGASLGILLASLVGGFTAYVFPEEIFNSWGWRLPYLCSGIICLFIYTTRLRLEETPVFEEYKKQHKLPSNPFSYLKKDIPSLLQTLGLVCMGSTFYYFCFIYIPIFLNQTMHYPLFKITILMSILMAAMFVLVPMGGLICDRFGRKRMLVLNACLVSILIVPGFYFLQSEYFIFALISLLIFTLASSLEQGTTPVCIVENYPMPARYTGVSLSYNLGNGILGGTVPIVCEWLIYKTDTVMAPAYYILFYALITVCVALSLRSTQSVYCK
jgi:MHS family proline/betaine transporter-like MFS transporter